MKIDHLLIQDDEIKVNHLDIMDKVFDYLEVPDLSQASLVCKAWRKTSLSHLFSTLALTGPKNDTKWITRDEVKNQYIQDQLDDFLATLNKFGHLVKNFKMSYSPDYETSSKIICKLPYLEDFELCDCQISGISFLSLIQPLTNLEKLYLSSVHVYDNNAQITNQIYIEPFKLPSSLKVLKVRQLRFGERNRHNFFILLASSTTPSVHDETCQTLLNSHNTVEEISFDDSFINLFIPFITHYPTLTKLQLRLGYGNNIDDKFQDIFQYNPQLQYLTLDCNIIFESVFLAISKYCKNLKGFKINSNEFGKNKFPNFIQYCRKLDEEYFIMDYRHLDRWEFIDPLLGQMPEVRLLRVRLNDHFAEVTKSIAKYSHKLTHLMLEAPLSDQETFNEEALFTNFFQTEFQHRHYICYSTLKVLFFSGLNVLEFNPDYLTQFQSLKLICFTFNYKMKLSVSIIQQIRQQFGEYKGWEFKMFFGNQGHCIILKRLDSNVILPNKF